MLLRANKLSVNIEKATFCFEDQTLKIKLGGKRAILATSMKCLDVLLGEHLTWFSQISHVQMKLNQAIRILSKLRYQTWQLLGPNNKETQNQYRTLPKQNTQKKKKKKLKTDMKVQILSTKISTQVSRPLIKQLLVYVST